MRIWYETFSTSSMADKSLYQGFRPSFNMAVNIIRAGLVNVGGATANNLRMILYAEKNAAPGALIGTSEARQLAEFSEKANGYYDVYFRFNFATWLAKGSNYFICINADEYTFSEGAHLGWRRDYPDTSYPEHFEATSVNANSAPFVFHVNGQGFYSL